MSHSTASERAGLPAGEALRTLPENRLFFPALDGLRTIAFVMVFLQHYLELPFGYTGVDLFFVLSGFLITGILYDTADRKDRFTSFYVRRSLRVFPLYYTVLLAVFLVAPLAGFRWNHFWLAWPLYLGNIIRYIHPFWTSPAYTLAADGQMALPRFPGVRIYIGHFWSLALEEQFYLAWPLVVFWVRDRKRLLWICALVTVIMPIVRIIVMARLPVRYMELELPYRFTPLRLDALLIGGLLALLYRSSFREVALRFAGYGLILCGVLVLVIIFFFVAHHTTGLNYSARLTWGQSFVDLLYTFLVACALVPNGVVYRLCTLKPLRWLGRISYGLYVFHDIPHLFYEIAAAHVGRHLGIAARHLPLTTAIIAAAVTLPLAWLSFRYFETPFLNLKEKWAPSQPPRKSLSPS